MVKRVKRAEKGIESLKNQIEEHFIKIEADIRENNIDRGRYHFKEIAKSLLVALEIKIKILGTKDDRLVQSFRERLEKLRKRLDLDESV